MGIIKIRKVMRLLLSFSFCLLIGIPVNSQSMPNIFGNPPVDYSESDLVVVTVRTTSEAIKKLVPEPLVPKPGGLIDVAIGIQNVTGIMSYLEMYITIPVTFNGKEGVFLPILFLDKAAPIVAGREIIGFPKVDGELEYSIEGKVITASVKRKGTVLMEFSANLNSPIVNTFENEISHGFVIKEIPSSVGSSIPEVKQVNSYVFRNTSISNIEPCSEVTLQITPSTDNFMPAIPVLEVMRSSRAKLSFTLDYGEIEYDYLRE
jgi:acetoacetate decarboxylase